MKKWLPMLMALLLCAGSLLVVAEEAACIGEQTDGIILDEVEEDIPVLPEELAALSEDYIELPDDFEVFFDDSETALDESLIEIAQADSNEATVQIDAASFPDGTFRDIILSSLDTDGDQRLSGYERDLAVNIDVSSLGIANLKGIEYFSKLETLYCAGNKLTALELDHNPALKYLDCSRNAIKTLKVSSCKALEYLDCSKNHLKGLDVNACKALRELYCAGNRIKKLNLRNNGALIVLDCQDNKLKSIDASKNAELSALDCHGNDIASINVSKLSAKLRGLIKGDKGRWNDGILFWYRSEREYLRLPGLAKVYDGKKTIFDKSRLVKHLYIFTDRNYYGHLNDSEYANFRNVSTKGIGKRALYRGSSPLMGRMNRNNEAMAAMERARVRTVINMCEGLDSAKIRDGYCHGYYGTINVWARRMNNRYVDKQSMNDMKDICLFMIQNEGPYMIHCIYGRDRTGFLCAVLECLMGASEKEVVRDYMKSYSNYYNIKPGSWEYDYIAQKKIKKQLKRAFGSSQGIKSMSLAKGAEKYLKKCGLSQANIAALKKRLDADY